MQHAATVLLIYWDTRMLSLIYSMFNMHDAFDTLLDRDCLTIHATSGTVLVPGLPIPRPLADHTAGFSSKTSHDIAS